MNPLTHTWPSSISAFMERVDFLNAEGDGYQCTCHISPPCMYCTDPANPASAIEDENEGLLNPHP